MSEENHSTHTPSAPPGADSRKSPPHPGFTGYVANIRQVQRKSSRPYNLNRFTPKPSTNTLNPALQLFCILLISLTFPSLATADEDGDEPTDEIRFETSVQPDEARPTLNIRVYRPADESRNIWHVTVHSEDAPDDYICLTTLPLEAGEEFYEYTLDHISLGDEADTWATLLEATPTGDGAPIDPPAYQLAFTLTPDDSTAAWRCNLVARGEYTELDGGPRLSIDDDIENPRLLRSDITERLEFCGTRDDETDDFERFEPDIGRFFRGTPLDITSDDAKTLIPKLPDRPIEAPLTTGFYSWIVASSDIRGAPPGAAAPRPTRLGELDTSTAWMEGADGLGIGEFVTAGIDDTASIRAIRIYPGHGSSADSFQAYARPTRLLIGLADGERYVLDFPDYYFDDVDESAGFLVKFPEPVTSNCLSVMILDATSGEPPDDTDPQHRRFAEAVAISEITPYSEFDASTEKATARLLVEEIARESDLERRDRIVEFGALIPHAMVDATREVLEEEDEQRRSRVVPLLGRIDPSLSLPLLRAHFLSADVEDEDYRRTKRAIAAHGSQGAPILLDVLNELEMEDKKYVDATRLVGRIGSDVHLQRLIAELGKGDEFLRRERVRAVANGGIGVVPALITHAESRPDTDAGLDALSALVFIGQRHFAQKQADVDRSHELRAIYFGSEQRSHRVRAIEAMGYFSHPDAATLIGEDILADDPDPVVRAFAAKALQLYPEASARQSLEIALDDESPDVRIAAIRSLNRRDDAAKATDAVIAYVDRENWPAGLHHGLQLLANSPHAEAAEAIAELIADDITSAKASSAMRALRRAERSLPRSHIKAHLADDATPHSILSQLVQMLGLADFDGADEILIAIADRRYEPLDARPSDLLDSLAHRAFLALGTTRSDTAREFLFDTAFDTDRPISDRYHALHGLGFFPDADLLVRLQDRSAEIPPDLRRRFRQTISMIENRLAIEDAEDELEDLIEGLEDESKHDLHEEPFNDLPESQ